MQSFPGALSEFVWRIALLISSMEGPLDGLAAAGFGSEQQGQLWMVCWIGCWSVLCGVQVFDQGSALGRQQWRATRSWRDINCLQGAKELLGIVGVSIALNFFGLVPPPLALHLSKFWLYSSLKFLELCLLSDWGGVVLPLCESLYWLTVSVKTVLVYSDFRSQYLLGNCSDRVLACGPFLNAISWRDGAIRKLLAQ